MRSIRRTVLGLWCTNNDKGYNLTTKIERQLAEIMACIDRLPSEYLFKISFMTDCLIKDRDEGYQQYIAEQEAELLKQERVKLTIVKVLGGQDLPDD
jgi:hypothetical protein